MNGSRNINPSQVTTKSKRIFIDSINTNRNAYFIQCCKAKRTIPDFFQILWKQNLLNFYIFKCGLSNFNQFTWKFYRGKLRPPKCHILNYLQFRGQLNIS